MCRPDRRRRAELGFKVSLLKDACAAVDERIERVALDYLDAVVGVVIEPA